MVHMAGISRQKGVATLIVSMVLLVAVTLLVLYTSQTAVMEQRMAANEVRDKQARAAAQAGIDQAIAHLNEGGNLTDALVADALTNSSYRVAYCSNALAVTALPTCGNTVANLACGSAPAATDTRAWAVACGWSDDNTGRKRIINYIGKADALPYVPKNPLIAKGTISTTGSATVFNYYTNLTIWSGNAVDLSGGSAKTFVRAPSQSAPSTATGADTFKLPASSCSGVSAGSGQCPGGTSCTDTSWFCTSSATVGGPDVLSSDTSLSRLSNDQYFANFLGHSPDTYKAMMTDQSIAAADFSQLANVTDKVIWVEGDLSSCTGCGSMTIGSESEPVVLIIDGNVSTSLSGLTIYGFVFVRGNWTSSGGPRIMGAAAIQGGITGSGSLEVVYDPVALANTNKLDKFGSLPGGWRDW